MSGMEIFILGPGGIGKMSTGRSIARALNQRFVNLNAEFSDRFGDINPYTETHGKEAYYHKNSQMFERLLKEGHSPRVWGLSYGFLIHEERPDIAARNCDFMRTGKSFFVLPYEDLEKSYEYVNAKRSTSLLSKLEEERDQFINRAERYMDRVDAVIYSDGDPQKAAEAILKIL